MAKKNTEKRKGKVIGYIRVSTPEQSTKKNQHAILTYCNQNEFGKVSFIEETVTGRKPWKKRQIGKALERMGQGDRLVVPELTRLGRSTLDVLELLRYAKTKGIEVHSIKEGLVLNGKDSIQSKIMVGFITLFCEVERDFISMRTREGLAAAKRKGIVLGRPKGIPGPSKLDPHRSDIKKELKMGVPKTRIARKYGTSTANLYNWLKMNKVDMHGQNS